MVSLLYKCIKGMVLSVESNILNVIIFSNYSVLKNGSTNYLCCVFMLFSITADVLDLAIIENIALIEPEVTSKGYYEQLVSTMSSFSKGVIVSPVFQVACLFSFFYFGFSYFNTPPPVVPDYVKVIGEAELRILLGL